MFTEVIQVLLSTGAVAGMAAFIVKSERKRTAPVVYEPSTDPRTDLIRYWVIQRTGLSIENLYLIKGHWYTDVNGARVKVEDLFRSPKYHYQTEAEEALRRFQNATVC